MLFPQQTLKGDSINSIRTILPIALMLLALGPPGSADAIEQRGIHAIFRSTDHGHSWSRSDTGLPDSVRVNALASFGDLLFAGTDGGIYVSHDAGERWQLVSGAAVGGRRVLCLARVGDTLLAGTDGDGILGTTDQGRTWKPFNQGLQSRKVLSLVTLDEAVFAGTDLDGVFLSRNGGKTWQLLNQGMPSGAQIFSMAAIGKKVFAGLYSKGIYRLDDQQKGWERVGPLTSLVLTSAGDTLVAGENPGGIFWSADLGERWSRGVPRSPMESVIGGVSPEMPVWAMASGGGVVLAGAARGIYVSDDNGVTWARARLGLPEVCPGVAFVATEQVVLAGVIITDESE